MQRGEHGCPLAEADYLLLGQVMFRDAHKVWTVHMRNQAWCRQKPSFYL